MNSAIEDSGEFTLSVGAPAAEDWQALEQGEVDPKRTLAAHLATRSPGLLSWLLSPRLTGTQFRLGMLFWLMLGSAWWLYSWRSVTVFLITEGAFLSGATVALLDPIATRRQRILAAALIAFLIVVPWVVIVFTPVGRRF
jgi:hypothetical protein